jgi:AbrB family looped-hinge helix DNA binding protein
MTQEILQIRSNGQITLPPELRRKAHLAEGDFLEATLAEDGTVCLKPQLVIDRDQAWFWSSRWQAGEKAAEADINDGRVATFDSIGDLLKDLDDGE